MTASYTTAWDTTQVVRGKLEQEGFQLMSWQGNRDVQPSIWFVGSSGKPEWVVVRVTQYPTARASRPDNWQDIANRCAGMSRIGHFASVAVASAEQPHHNSPLPLWRGHGLVVAYEGLS